MKRVLLMVLSIILVLASIFGMFACVAGVRDILNINEYKNADAAYARENLVTARDGIAQLKENEQTYIEGVSTYTAGQQTLANGYAAYAAGKQTLAEGQATIDANTDAYNEGKETLSKIEPLLPYLNQYVQFRDGTLAKLPGFDSAQAWFVSVVRPIGAKLGLEIPDDVTDFPAYINQMVADGKAQLKEYEDGLVAIEEGKVTLADAAQQLAQGEIDLANGAAQLSVFEEGELTLAAGGLALFEGMQPCFSYYNGEETVQSLPEMLAVEFGLDIPDNLIVVENGVAKVNEEVYEEFGNYVLQNMYKVDENGQTIVKNGHAMLDLDKCSTLCDMAEQYLVNQEADIKGEVYVRIAMYAAIAVACILGIIAGIMGIVASVSGGKKTGKTLGIIAAVLSVAALVTGFITKFADYTYTIRVDQAGNYINETASALDFVPVQQYSGSLQLAAIWVMAIVTVLFVVFACMASKAAKDKAAARAAAAVEDYDEAVYAAAAAAAAAAVAEEKVIAAETPAAAPAEEAPVVEEAPTAEAAPEDETVKE